MFGKNVKEIEEGAFNNAMCIRTVEFPNVTKVGKSAFLCCYKLHTFIAPKCTLIGENAFTLTMNLKTFVAAPEVLESETFLGCGLKHLDLPSVKKMNSKALQFSKFEGIKLENCAEFEEDALKNDFGVVEVQTKTIGEG